MRSDINILVRSNILASIAALVSVAMWTTDLRQIGSPAAVAPVLALCCGLFGIVASVWMAFRDSRPLSLIYGLWALIPVLWIVYFVLVLNPAAHRF